MQAAMPDPRWMPGQAAGERLSLCRRGPDGIAANWPWTASRRCCCSVRCPRRRCRWRRPGACWRACTNRPSSGACATSCNWATRCSAASARSAPGAACCSPRNLRACPERLLEHMETFLQRSAEGARATARRDAWPACAKPSPTTCAEHRVASPSEHGAPWAEHLGGGAGRSRLLAEAALGLSGDDLLAAQARLLEARGGWWVLPAGAEASHAVTRRQPRRRYCGVGQAAALLRWRSRRDQGCATAGGALPAPCGSGTHAHHEEASKQAQGSVWQGFPGFDNRLRHDRPGRFTSRSAP